MECRLTSDPVGVLEAVFYRMFYFLFNSDSARSNIGFKFIHHFTDSEGMPGWYLWLDGRPGAYQIMVDNNQCVSNLEIAPGMTARSYFTVRYFPAIHETCFDALSAHEQILRQSDLFDSTGTPTYHARQSLHPSYFTIGHFAAGARSCRDVIELSFWAPSKWVDIRQDGLYLADNQGKTYQVATPGAKDREFPGWELCHPLFDHLISGFCYVHQQKPLICGLAKTEGHVFIIDAQDNVRLTASDDIEEIRLFAVIPIDGDCKNGIEFKHIVDSVEGLCHEGTHKQQPLNWQLVCAPESIVNNWINPLWWQIGRHKYHDVATAGHCCYCNH